MGYTVNGDYAKVDIIDGRGLGAQCAKIEYNPDGSVTRTMCSKRIHKSYVTIRLLGPGLYEFRGFTKKKRNAAGRFIIRDGNHPIMNSTDVKRYISDAIRAISNQSDTISS